VISRVLRGSACQVKYTAVKRMVKPSLVLLSVMQGHLVGQPQAETGRGGARSGEQAEERVGGSGDVEHGAAGWAAAPLLTCAPALARPTI
jgi:hypothetical protein